MPSRSSFVPRHVKFETVNLLEMLVPSAERTKWRGRYKPEDVKAFNEDVWGTYFNLGRMKAKCKSFNFHHEITNDGISASILFSREKTISKKCTVDLMARNAEISNVTVGIDPGRANIITMIDQGGLALRYTSRQSFVHRAEKALCGCGGKGAVAIQQS